MSVKISHQVWQHSNQSLGSLLVLLAIADFADDDGIAFPSIPTLAYKSRLSTRQVKRLLKAMAEEGELEIEEGMGPRGANRYRIRDDKLSRGVTSATGGGDIRDRQGVTSATGGGDILSTPYKEGTVIEPSIEPSGEPKDMSSKPHEEILFDHYKLVHKKPKAQLVPARRKLIRARLKEYSLDDLKLAVDGCKRSLFHQGANDRNQTYDSIELILRDAKHVEQFMEFATGNGRPQMSKTALHNQEVLRRFEEREEARRNAP